MALFYHYLTLGYLLHGIALTLLVTAYGLAGGLGAGIVLAAMQLSGQRWMAALARGYTVVFRGTPLILQMVFVYDALPHFGIRWSAVASAGVALAMNEAPFIAEILRSGIVGVDRGQVLAGRALGMPARVLMRHVVAPQAIRTMIPAFGNEAVSALKNSSLASFISVQELTLRSTQLASSTFDFFSVFFASGLFYLLLTGTVSLLQLIAERVLDLDRPMSGPARRMRGWPWLQALWPATRRAALPVPSFASSPVPATAPPATQAGGGVASNRRQRAQGLAAAPIAVEVRDLTMSYGKQCIFSALSLRVHSGEVVALLGPSGSGKSTLLRCLNRLETWDSGSVFISGRRIGMSAGGVVLSTSALARQRVEVGVGMVFQHFNLFAHLSARENIAGPLRWVHRWSAAAADARTQELLDRVGLADRADALPRHLSGGQQQRVAIARAIATRPRVLLLDEPTSALDPEMVGEVLDVIRRLASEEGLTMLISTHQLRFAEEVADRVVFLAQGSIVEDGPAHEVLHTPSHPLTSRFIRVMAAGQLSGEPA
ncbi:amino acid ABC transporter permease/ATP-binding protein [Thiomonas sp. FB-6]|uniref:amino acid ABC transporter permease/ATP-binding protein n=1 Tax=Thiomonas sp. FB-6 TaxID=1158291 RepID=UPI00037E82CB|nr:amino acid ABC transporter permease/ATP-binding protein [Thiomonas sp. FB-6]